jgi:hypothetical protein
MKINIDDPKLTAYALGELDEAERSAIARVIADSPGAQHFIADTQQFARLLKSQYKFELEREFVAREKFIAIRDDSFWSKAGPLAIAALLAVLAVVVAVAFGTNKFGGTPSLTGSASRELAGGRPGTGQSAPIEAEEAPQGNENPIREADAGPYAYTGERPFVSVLSRPQSSFPITVSAASYLDVRHLITAGVLPPRGAVRIEGMVNYFSYDYPQPMGHEPFSINVDVVTCPWEPAHRLVRIGLKGREAAAVVEDSRIEVEFNPRRAVSYRLIGYDRQTPETTNLNQKPRPDWIAAGYSMTAFYEAVPHRQQSATVEAPIAGRLAEPLLSAKLKFHTRSSDAIQTIERTGTDSGSAFADAPQDLKFAAAVAEFGMILRDSEYKGNGSLQQVVEWAQQGKGADISGYRADFIQLVRKAAALKRG